MIPPATRFTALRYLVRNPITAALAAVDISAKAGYSGNTQTAPNGVSKPSRNGSEMSDKKSIPILATFLNL